MKTNQAGLDLIKEFEGLELTAYRDPVGILTIGYGHTSAAGAPHVSPVMNITKQQAEDILRNDLVKYEQAVTSAVHVPISSNQFSALVSFTYNLGPGNLGSSTLLKKLNAGDYAGAANEFPRWNKAGGKVLNGIVRRRAAEQALFRKDDARPAPKPETPAQSDITPAVKSGGIIAALVTVLAKLFGGK